MNIAKFAYFDLLPQLGCSIYMYLCLGERRALTALQEIPRHCSVINEQPLHAPRWDAEHVQVRRGELLQHVLQAAEEGPCALRCRAVQRSHGELGPAQQHLAQRRSPRNATANLGSGIPKHQNRPEDS